MKKYILLSLITIGCFGVENTTEAHEPTFDDVLEWIEEAENSPLETCENGIILLGASGEGKSTLANLLAGNDLQAQTTETFNRCIRLSDPDSAISKIEHDISQSGTDRIIALKTQDGTTLWDCPGFFDTKGIRKQFINSFTIHTLIQRAKNAKIALIIDKCKFESRGACAFIQLVTKLRSMFNGNLEDCTTVVITKTYPGAEMGILELLKKIIANKLCKLNKLENTPEVAEDKKSCELISKLIEDKHIAFFPCPTEEDGAKVSEKTADAIMDVINRSKCATFRGKKPLVMSNGVALCLHNVKDSCNQKLEQIISDLRETILSILQNSTKDQMTDMVNALQAHCRLSVLQDFISDEEESIKFTDNCNTLNRIISFLSFAGSVKGIKMDTDKYGEPQCVKKLCDMITIILRNRKTEEYNKALAQRVKEYEEDAGIFSSVSSCLYYVFVYPVEKVYELVAGTCTGVANGMQAVSDFVSSLLGDDSDKEEHQLIIYDAVAQAINALPADPQEADIENAFNRVLEVLRNDERLSDVDNLENIARYIFKLYLYAHLNTK